MDCILIKLGFSAAFIEEKNRPPFLICPKSYTYESSVYIGNC